MACFPDFVLSLLLLAGKSALPLIKGGRKPHGAKRGKVKGLSGKERPVLQRRLSFSVERDRSKKI